MPIVNVTAAPGRRVPQESHPRRYYPAAGEPALGVERTPYVSRLIQQGDLVVVADAAATDATAKPVKPARGAA